MKAFGLAAFFLAATTPAAAQSWRPLNILDEGKPDMRIAYLDQASLRALPGGRREMRIAQYRRHRKPLPSGRLLDWTDTLYSLDCAAKTMRRTRMASMSGTRAIATQAVFDELLPFATDVALYRAAEIACGGSADTLRQASADLLPHGNRVFWHLDALNRSATSTHWFRMGIVGSPGDRVALFLDRASIRVMSGRARSATMATVSEAPGTSAYSLTSVEVDCSVGARQSVLAGSYRPSGRVLTFPDDRADPLTPGTLYGTLRAPICSSDFSGGRAYAQVPGSLRSIAFAP